jgi:hypothetical protein
MAKFMLVLRNEPGVVGKMSPEEMQRMMERYMEWRQRPFVADGKGLMDTTGRVLSKANGAVHVTEGPFIEAREVVGGYYLIEAADWDEAVALASDNPHLEFGPVEIREFVSE